jgi:hypothetical protein
VCYRILVCRTNSQLTSCYCCRDLQITVPNVADVVASLGAQVTKWPRLPLNMPSMNLSLPQLPDLQLPDLEDIIRHKFPAVNVTGMQLPDLVAPEAPQMPNFQFDFSGIQEIANAIRAGLSGKLPQIEEVTIEQVVPAGGDAAGSVVAASASKGVTIDGKDMDATPKVGSSSTTVTSATTVTTVPNTAAATDAAPAADAVTATTVSVATPAAAAAAVAAAPAPAADAAAAAAMPTVAASVGSAGEVISETEVTVATPVPVDVAAPAAAAPNKRVAGNNKGSGSTWGNNKQQ